MPAAEEISRGLATNDSIRAIAEALGRSLDDMPGGQRQRWANQVSGLLTARAPCLRGLRPPAGQARPVLSLRGIIERKLEARAQFEKRSRSFGVADRRCSRNALSSDASNRGRAVRRSQKRATRQLPRSRMPLHNLANSISQGRPPNATSAEHLPLRSTSQQIHRDAAELLM